METMAATMKTCRHSSAVPSTTFPSPKAVEGNSGHLDGEPSHEVGREDGGALAGDAGDGGDDPRVLRGQAHLGRLQGPKLQKESEGEVQPTKYPMV